MVNTDQQRVMQVLLGLQSNALKFTQDGYVNIRVRIKSQFLQIEVKDTGIGISKENQKKLFKLFGFLQESEMHNKNGVGLGLAISKQIVEQYEGNISLKSKEGEGSSFTFKFKIYPQENHDNNENQSQIQKVSQFKSNSRNLVYKWKPVIFDNDFEYIFDQYQSMISVKK